MDENKIQAFREAIDSSNNIVFFGGAGVSTESGMKDYRSSDGLYALVQEYGVPPEEILSKHFFERSPEVFYDFYFKYLLHPDVQPNAAHYVLSEMEKTGKLNAVITQNVDGLHQKAGSKNILELHGTTAVHRCHHCRTEYPTDEVITLGGKVPHCRSCGGPVRPDAVMYGEALNGTVVSLAVGAISSADMLIIGGTSLAVYPASAYLQYFRGRKIVLINKGKAAYDSRADIVFHDSIGEVLRRTICK